MKLVNMAKWPLTNGLPEGICDVKNLLLDTLQRGSLVPEIVQRGCPLCEDVVHVPSKHNLLSNKNCRGGRLDSQENPRNAGHPLSHLFDLLRALPCSSALSIMMDVSLVSALVVNFVCSNNSRSLASRSRMAARV